MLFRTISLLLLAVTPAAFSQSANFVFSAIDSSGNTTSLTPGAGITFPQTSIGSSSSITMVIKNQGTGSGIVNGILATSPFQVSGAPSPGTAVAAGGSVRFGLNFAPAQAGSFQGSLQINL